jgi:hypothetical protein
VSANPDNLVAKSVIFVKDAQFRDWHGHLYFTLLYDAENRLVEVKNNSVRRPDMSP